MHGKMRTRHSAGFSLAETLLAVLILSLVAALLASGIPFAKSAYERVVVGANARLLLSNTVATLKNELGTATNVSVNPTKKSMTYYSTDIHSNSSIYLEKNGAGAPAQYGPIMLKQYITLENDALDASVLDTLRQPRRLVSVSASNKDLYVTFDDISVSGDAITLSGLKVIRETNTEGLKTLYSLDQLIVRPVVGPVTVDTSTDESGT